MALVPQAFAPAVPRPLISCNAPLSGYILYILIGTVISVDIEVINNVQIYLNTIIGTVISIDIKVISNVQIYIYIKV